MICRPKKTSIIFALVFAKNKSMFTFAARLNQKENRIRERGGENGS